MEGRVLFIASLFAMSLIQVVSYFSRPTRPAITIPYNAVSSSSRFASSALSTFDYQAASSLPWSPNGYSTWKWEDQTINYVELGDRNKPKLLLIHGFGASAFHWRYNLPVLARDFHVFAIDLLGFGLSDKPIIDYHASVWRDQALDFIVEVMNAETRGPCVVAGNSLGGYTALYAASSDRATKENLISGCILLNGAGRFRPTDGSAVPEKKQDSFWQPIASALQRLVINLSFLYTKQPVRIAQVLRQVYPVNQANVNDELVESIRLPAQHPNAAEVFYRIITENGSGPGTFVDDLLSTLKVPLLLLWGMQDPWIRPGAADRIQQLYPTARRVEVNAGHCPHDEAPEAVNAAIKDFAMDVLRSSSSAANSSV
jgi:pimeloyl-ACP methyl ester carboxylesterase